jgi:F420-non-reducing hydrogenase large subunit
VLNAAERITELSELKDLTSPEIRNMNFKTPGEGVGIVEAPRGTLIHHYQANEKGLITKANLIVATVGNAAAINMSIERAAKKLSVNKKVDEQMLNMIEMAFRAYDPCLSCATHSLPGKMPLELRFKDKYNKILRTVFRNNDGKAVSG